MVVSRQFNYTKGTGSMPFILPTLLGFQGSTHRFGVGSFSYPAVNAVPAAALSTNNGLFNKDCKRAWEKIGKLPVDKWDVQYYSMKKPRKSFLIKKTANSFKMGNCSEPLVKP